MNRAQKAKKRRYFTAQGVEIGSTLKTKDHPEKGYYQSQIQETLIVDREKSLGDLKIQAKALGIKGWNFFRDPEKLAQKIEDHR